MAQQRRVTGAVPEIRRASKAGRPAASIVLVTAPPDPMTQVEMAEATAALANLLALGQVSED